MFPAARIESIVFLGFFYQLLQVPAVVVLGFWFVLQLISGVTALGAETANGGVAFFAHIGGFALGVIVGLIVRVVGAGAARRGPGARPDGIIPPWVGSSRWSSRASASTCSRAATS